jgi:hypothetical protein
MAFHIGVSGHRSLPGADIDGLRAAAAGLFRAVRTEALALHAADQAAAIPLYAPAPPLLRCVCGLAEGADSIFAEAALDEAWQLVAMLPFAPDAFAVDFTGAALDRYHRLLARADVVCALDGDRDSDHAYADTGDQIVEQSDILLTLWDRRRAQGLGGTGDVVRHALQAGLPVAVLPPSGPPVLTWLGTIETNVAAMLHAAMLPPASGDGFPQACFSDRPRGDGWAGTVLRAYDRVVTIGLTPSGPAPPARAAFAPEVAVLDPAFRSADQLATEYAARYRVDPAGHAGFARRLVWHRLAAAGRQPGGLRRAGLRSGIFHARRMGAGAAPLPDVPGARRVHPQRPHTDPAACRGANTGGRRV